MQGVRYALGYDGYFEYKSSGGRPGRPNSTGASTGDAVTDTVHGIPRIGYVTRGKRIGTNYIIKY